MVKLATPILAILVTGVAVPIVDSELRVQRSVFEKREAYFETMAKSFQHFKHNMEKLKKYCDNQRDTSSAQVSKIYKNLREAHIVQLVDSAYLTDVLFDKAVLHELQEFGEWYKENSETCSETVLDQGTISKWETQILRTIYKAVY